MSDHVVYKHARWLPVTHPTQCNLQPVISTHWVWKCHFTGDFFGCKTPRGPLRSTLRNSVQNNHAKTFMSDRVHKHARAVM